MITLRSALFTDYTAIAQLHTNSWQQNYRGIYSDHYLDHEAAADRVATWHNRLKKPDDNQRITVATLEDNIVGFACLRLQDDPVYGTLLDNLHVTGSLQHAGIGKLLMRACAEQIFDECNSRKMYLWVYELNTRARKVYEHLGAKNIELTDKSTPGGKFSSCCRYAWDDIGVLI